MWIRKEWGQARKQARNNWTIGDDEVINTFAFEQLQKYVQSSETTNTMNVVGYYEMIEQLLSIKYAIIENIACLIGWMR